MSDVCVTPPWRNTCSRLPGQAGSGCDTCDSPCSRPRPAGCQHGCERGCHGEPCPPCRQHRRLRCHCQLGVLHVRCHELSEAGDAERERLLCCGNPCPRTVRTGGTESNAHLVLWVRTCRIGRELQTLFLIIEGW